MTDRDLIKELISVWDNRVRWKLSEVVEKMRSHLAAPPPVHTCNYFCSRPECIKVQRDELREILMRDGKYWPVTSRPTNQESISWLQVKNRA
jgi:hypothetical protein